jgi:hypothetical protein
MALWARFQMRARRRWREVVIAFTSHRPRSVFPIRRGTGIRSGRHRECDGFPRLVAWHIRQNRGELGTRTGRVQATRLLGFHLVVAMCSFYQSQTFPGSLDFLPISRHPSGQNLDASCQPGFCRPGKGPAFMFCAHVL